ncbi:sensor histidine kinase [Nitrospina watsonii]|uniref:histidine kinase n=1 Tax=Nitrospina watsonii TaxID=1323948 RepID=A0ABN8W402_9BACT|nr:response regulator [Nitrospina watsonii]CAI2718986.1 Putative Histidine kinase [Nitrospina watsonii]
MVTARDITASRILIVDDELTNVQLLEKVLEHDGYRNFQSVTDPRRVLDTYRSFRPDLVLLDLNMPVIDGFEIMERLKEIEKESYLPVLVLTAQADLETRLRALRMGARDYVNKPFEISEICSRIRNILEVRLLHNQIQSQNQILEEKISERTATMMAYHEQLMHAEKLSAVGKLAASIAHEINNPLMGVRNILEQIRGANTLNEELQGLTDLAVRETTRVMDLATRLRQFYRPSTGKAVALDLHQVFDDMMALKVKNFKNKNIQVVKQYAENLPKVTGVEDQVKQVALNLLQNAEEAIHGPNGKIRVVTSVLESEVTVQVEDTGCGIASEDIPKIFEPFYTTKAEVKGTGLGLSVSYGIVQKHGGSIECASTPGSGTRFTLKLPIFQNGGMLEETPS